MGAFFSFVATIGALLLWKKILGGSDVEGRSGSGDDAREGESTNADTGAQFDVQDVRTDFGDDEAATDDHDSDDRETDNAFPHPLSPDFAPESADGRVTAPERDDYNGYDTSDDFEWEQNAPLRRWWRP